MSGIKSSVVTAMHGLPLAPLKPHSLSKTTEPTLTAITLETTFPYSRSLHAHKRMEMTVATAVGTTGFGNICKLIPLCRLCTIHSSRILAIFPHAIRLKSMLVPLHTLKPSQRPHTFKLLTTRQTPSLTTQTSNPP